MGSLHTNQPLGPAWRSCSRWRRRRRPHHNPSTPLSARAQLEQHSSRKRDIVDGIARGAELGIAETTVKIHVQHVLRKLDVSTRVQAAVLAANAGVN